VSQSFNSDPAFSDQTGFRAGFGLKFVKMFQAISSLHANFFRYDRHLCRQLLLKQAIELNNLQ